MNENLLANIEKIGVVDDNEASRNTLGFIVEDANLQPVFQNDAVTDLDKYLASIKERFDAIVTDHHLKKVKSYFPVNGAELAANCYGLHMPSLLVTRYEQPEILEIRKFRKKIPVVLNPDEYNPDTLIYGLEKCIKEFKGNFTVGRKSWRTLIRIDDVSEDKKNLFIIIPSWNSQQAIALNMPEELKNKVGSDTRLFAKVNIGNENPNELFITDWEL